MIVLDLLPFRRAVRHLPLCLVFIVLICLAGCARQTAGPKTSPLAPAEEHEALSRLRALAASPQPSTVETGYDLSWQIMGQSGKLAAQLWMDAPEFFRFSLHDPLGRTLYLAVSDSERFTLFDNRAAVAKKGRVEGAVWRRFVPEPLAMKDLAPLLGGRITKAPLLAKAAGNPDGSGWWYEWREGDLDHRLLLDKETGQVARRIILGKDRAALLDISYLNYDEDRASGYLWPGKTEITGSLVRGRLLLERGGPLSFDPLPLSVFHPEMPGHFKEEWVK